MNENKISASSEDQIEQCELNPLSEVGGCEEIRDVGCGVPPPDRVGEEVFSSSGDPVFKVVGRTTG